MSLPKVPGGYGFPVEALVREMAGSVPGRAGTSGRAYNNYPAPMVMSPVQGIFFILAGPKWRKSLTKRAGGLGSCSQRLVPERVRSNPTVYLERLA